MRADDFRQSLIAKIGAWSLDHKGQKPVMSEIFADLLRKLKDAYYEKHKKTIAKGVQDLVMLLSGNEGHLSSDARTRADTALATMIDPGAGTARVMTSTSAIVESIGAFWRARTIARAIGRA